jgi:alcohol dehydrogenase
MRAVYLESGRVEVRDFPVPARQPGYALIRLLTGGICNTDLELQRGYYGFSGIPGHEFVGEVAACDAPELLGKRVVGEINLGCRKAECTWCSVRTEHHCPDRTVLGIVKHPGAFQEFFTLPESNLHVVPDSIPTEIAVFTEPLAAACRILEQVRIERGEKVAVLGDGKLGLLIAQALQVHGAHVHQYGRHAEKLAIAERVGVKVRDSREVPRAAYRWVVDATGSPEGLKTVIAMTEPEGVVILKSTVHGEVPLDMAPVIVDEITLVGSRCGPFPRALELLEQGKIDVRSMISGEMPLEKAPEAFARAAQKGVMKVLLKAV